MCTAVSYGASHHYFGRTLDYEISYGERVVVTPRGYAFPFKYMDTPKQPFALCGMGIVADGVPLYYDAMNEHGLAMAGLLFAGNAVYRPCAADKDNIASFECIPWVLTQCKSVEQAKELLKNVHITDDAFNAQYAPTPLHWLIADKTQSVVLESDKTGVHLYGNPFGVLTNNPPFPFHQLHMQNYLQLTNQPPQNRMYSDFTLQAYSRGLGAFGLPGDFSSTSRFVRAAFVRRYSVSPPSIDAEVQQFFHILRAVEVPRGCVCLEDGQQVMSIYTACCDTDSGVYYYNTYNDSTVHAVDMHQYTDGATPVVL